MHKDTARGSERSIGYDEKGFGVVGIGKYGLFQEGFLDLEEGLSWSTDHCHWAYLWVSDKRGLARLENPGMNFQ